MVKHAIIQRKRRTNYPYFIGENETTYSRVRKEFNQRFGDYAEYLCNIMYKQE